MEAMTGFSQMADEEGFIVTYPEGTKASDLGLRSWNARFCCRDAQKGGVDDIGFLSAIIDQMKARYKVSGILITGFSNGGMLTHLAGIELGDKLTAIAPVGATISKEITQQPAKASLPVLMVHGSEDHLVPFYDRADERFLPVSQVVDYWIRNNDCSPEPAIEASGPAIIETYPSAHGAEVRVVKVKSAGHVWPGSKVYLKSEPDPKAVDASRLIWDFFRARLS
jgi:polyhydroxybutyrate depolymerase